MTAPFSTYKSEVSRAKTLETTNKLNIENIFGILNRLQGEIRSLKETNLALLIDGSNQMLADIHLNGFNLDLDVDRDTYLGTDGDDHVELVMAGPSGQFDITINGADDFTFTANSFNVLAGSTINIASGATVTFGDGDSYIYEPADDNIEVVLAGATGEFSININGAEDFNFQANTLNILSGSHIEMADDTFIGFTGGGRIVFDSTPATDLLTFSDCTITFGTYGLGIIHSSAGGALTSSAIVNADLGNLGTAGTIPKFAVTGFADSILVEVAGGIEIPDDKWIGITGGAQIEFDYTPGVDEINFLNCYSGWGTNQPVSLIEIYDSSAHPILTITGAHATNYDPQIRFRTDAIPTVKWTMGVDATDDSFRIEYATGLGSANPGISINTSNNVGVGVLSDTEIKMRLYTDVTNANRYSFWQEATIISSVNGSHYGIASYNQVLNLITTGITNGGYIYAARFRSLIQAGFAGYNGTLTTMCGGLFEYGFVGAVANPTITTAAGIIISRLLPTGTMITAYDIKINLPTLGGVVGTDWCIKSENTAKSRFDGEIQVNSDTVGFVVGAAQDARFYYDGTDGNIDTSLIAASDLKITCGANKTIELQNVVYEDVRINTGSFDRPGSSDPAIVSYTPTGAGTATYLYEFQKNNIASFTVQIPHAYKEGEDIKVHLHWTPGQRGVAENGNTVGWKVDYAWANIDGTFGAIGTANLSDTCDGTNDKHLMTPEVTITGAGKTISSMLICNIKRTDTGADDTWATNTTGNLPLLLEIDFHFPVDTMGSRNWTAK